MDYFEKEKHPQIEDTYRKISLNKECGIFGSKYFTWLCLRKKLYKDLLILNESTVARTMKTVITAYCTV